MNKPLPPQPRRHLLGVALLALLASGTVRAQTAPTPTPDVNAAGSDDSTIELSPFVISADADSEGYRAKSTLAGTRLRTELKDVGSAISVVTKEFMRDLGATSNESLLTYTTSTEVGGVRGNFAGAGNGRELNEGGLLLRPSSNTRVRGLTSADNTRDYFLTDIPWDGYNVSRVDLQRGPNAILFGLGSPAGIINNSTNQATFKNENHVEARFDDQGSIRTNGDFNYVLLPNELALRFDVVRDDSKYRQKPAFSRDDRYFGALRYDPAFLKKNGMSTSFRLNYEKGDGHSNRPRTLPPTDNITAWWTQLNKATYDPSAAWASTGPRQFRVSGGDQNGALNGNYQPWLSDYGSIFGQVVAKYNPGSDTQASFGNMEANGYWGINAAGTVADAIKGEASANNYYGIGGNSGAWDKGISGIPFARQVGVNNYSGWANGANNPADPGTQGLPGSSLNAFRDRVITDTGVFDFYNNLLDGENKREWRGFEAANFALSQTFLDNRIGIEGVYDKQKYHDGQTSGVRQNIYIDPNVIGLDGKANPNLGEAFVQHNNGGNEYKSDSEASRVTAFGEFRATDVLQKGWLASVIGRHVLTGMYAKEEKETRNLNFLEYALDTRFMNDITGADVNGNKLGNRGPTIVSYISGDLRNVATPGGANLGRVSGPRVPAPQNGTVYRFDSHWNKPVSPSEAGYVNPADPWIDSGGGTSTQAENPANYKGWGNYPVGPLQSYDNGDSLYTNGILSYRKVQSQAFIWQGYLFDGVFVPTIGWRKDEFKGGNLQAPRTAQEQVTNLDWQIDKEKLPKQSGESISSSFVLHTPRRIRAMLPYDTGLSLFFNKSENFQPRPGDIDIFGNPLANPSGETKDYGFVISTLNDRLNLKVNWYKTEITNDRLSGFEFWRIPGTVSTLLTSAARVRNKDLANDWRWNYSQWPGGQALADKGAQLVLDAYNTNPVFTNFVNAWDMKQFVNAQDGSIFNTPPGTTATSDTTSKGIEFELSAKPIDAWDISFNASKTQATQNNIGGSLKTWIEGLDPLFQGPAGDLRQWWAGDSNTLRMVWNREVMSQYAKLKATEGQNQPEFRKWRFNLVNNYNFKKGFLKGSNIGAAYRWEDKIVIGYPIISSKDSTGNAVYTFDIAHPYMGPREDHLDLWVGYGRKLTSKIDWRIQFNIRDVLAKKELIPISVQPDGSPGAYRIPELTSWTVTNTFNF